MSGISDGTAKVGVIIPGSGINVDTYPSLEAAGIQLLRMAALRYVRGSTVEFVTNLREQVIGELNEIALEYMGAEEQSDEQKQVALFAEHYQIPKNVVYDPKQGQLGGWVNISASRPVPAELVTARWHGWKAARGI